MSNFISKLLDHNQPIESSPERISLVITNLETARFLCKRNIDTGEKITEEEVKIHTFLFEKGLYYSFFSGILCYLVFLEQLGQIFKFSSTNKNPIYKVLDQYNNTADEKENYALVGLRNALAHNGGLINKNDKYPKSKKYKFIFSMEESEKIIELPKTGWDGKYSNKSEDCDTIIYVNNFINLVEDIFRRVKEDAINRSLTSIDEQEIKTKFTIING